MHRRSLLVGGGSVLFGFSESAQAQQQPGWTNWTTPNVAPFIDPVDQHGRALKGFADILDRYGLYQPMQDKVTMDKVGTYSTLHPPAKGFYMTRMSFGTGQHVPNMLVTQADLKKPGWQGKSLGMFSWTVSTPYQGKRLIAQYYRFVVCKNPALFIGFMQEDCIRDDLLCGPDCDAIRRAQT